jgi:hypothetical protein
MNKNRTKTSELANIHTLNQVIIKNNTFWPERNSY